MAGKSGKNGWKNRLVGSGTENPEQLLANPLNYRTHPADQRQGVRGSLADVGWVGRVIVNKRTGKEWPKGERGVATVVDGHLRVELAMQQAEAEVPVDYVDLNPREEALVLATFDPLAGMAETDAKLLEELLGKAETDDQHLQGVMDNLALEASLYAEGGGGGKDEEETLLDQAIQLKPQREYVVLMCATGEEGAAEFEELREALELGMVRRGGYKAGSPFDATGVERVVKARFLLDVLAGLVAKAEGE